LGKCYFYISVIYYCIALNIKRITNSYSFYKQRRIGIKMKKIITQLFPNAHLCFDNSITSKISITKLSGNKRTNIKLIVLFTLIFMTPKFASPKDFWEDKNMLDSIKIGIHCTYNFEFDKAEIIFKKANVEYPNHPAVLMCEALILYWKYYPLQPNTETGNKFESLLLESLSESKQILQERPNHQLANFIAMMPRMMLLGYYADNGLPIKAIPHLSIAYKSVRRGFGFYQKTPEFYFSTGLYNYYREAYPEANPFYKPIVYLFPEGNKETGLKDLYKCWQTSGFIGAEALYFVSYIYINFEANYSEGVKYGCELNGKYPNNPLFAELYIQLLLLNKQYNEAEVVVNDIKSKMGLSDYFKITLSVYDAIIIEHNKTNLNLAENTYQSVVESMRKFGNYSRRYSAYAYFGLSRINKTKGFVEVAQQYKSQAIKIAQYPHVNFD